MRLTAQRALDMIDVVSIHASVKDATFPKGFCVNPMTVSIHASVKDATGDGKYGFKSSYVSIHASVKDATSAAKG